MKRENDFKERREHLKDLNNDELYERFWSLTEEIVKPMVELGHDYTSPAIERSVLLRMGFSSIEAKPIIDYGTKWNLLSKGIGNVVLTYGRLRDIPYLKAGEELSKGIGWDIVLKEMKGGER